MTTKRKMKKLTIRITGKWYRKLLFGMISVLICFVAFGQKKITPENVRKDRARNIVLPASDVHYQRISHFIEDEPDADYIHASEKAHEAFHDIKYSIRIHWGVYSMWEIGYEKPLKWIQTDKGVQIILPQEPQKPENSPCEHAWGFEFKMK
jgi:hypothetical protein